MDPRSLSAAFHSVSRRSANDGMPGKAAWSFFFRAGIKASCPLLNRH
jgi:hypothetical protein